MAQLENPLRLQRVQGTDRFGLRLVDNDEGRVALRGHLWGEYGPGRCGGQGPGAGRRIRSSTDCPLATAAVDAILYLLELGASVPRTHPRHHDCVHDETVSVIADGLERVICEQCGHVTVRYESMISGDVERSQFPRRADERARRSIQARWPYRGAG